MTTRKRKPKVVKLNVRSSKRKTKKKTRSPQKLKLERALQGTWSFTGNPEVNFRFFRKGDEIKLELDAPPTMSERAWKALFRFLSFNFDHLRVKIPIWAKPEVMRAMKQVRRKRWKRRYRRRGRKLAPPTPKVLSPLTPVPEEDTSAGGPSQDLQKVAKAVLKSKSKETP